MNSQGMNVWIRPANRDYSLTYPSLSDSESLGLFEQELFSITVQQDGDVPSSLFI